MVHVRDAVAAIADAELAQAKDLATELLMLAPSLTVEAAIRRMRASNAHIALVGKGPLPGLVSLEDLLEQMLGAFYDETDARVRRVAE